ncbi:MAG: response regulator [Lachnospiraceae bacterium]|nr:response regulator [Lachnospiraceae bacterium]
MGIGKNIGAEAQKGYIIVESGPDRPFKILYADQAACEMTGVSMEELLSATVPKPAPGYLDSLPVTLDACHQLWVLNTTDSRLKSEAELIRMNQKLEEALNAAEAANRAKSAFLSNMSHDIRTPMNAIAGMTSIALSHIDEKARVQDCLHKIQTASTHLMSLVNDVLDISRIDSGRLSLNEELFSLADLIHDVTVIIRPQAAQKGHCLKMEIGQIYEESLLGDSLRLRQILVNIIGNAIKYTPDNGNIQVLVSQYFVRDKAAEKEECLWLDFVCQDNGIGMSEDFLNRIFMPFERASNFTMSKIEGTGLGMSIVKSLTDRMGGRIQVESKEGLGSRFRIELPLTVMPKNGKSWNALAEKTVLIAESTDSRAEKIMACLRAENILPQRVKNALDAVAWLIQAQSEGHMPCALLLGQELEDMPVLDLAAHVRQSAGPDFPILLISEADWAQLEYRATRAGVNAFVPCPLFKSRLLDTLAALMEDGSAGEKASAVTSADYSGCHVLLVEDNELNQEIAMEMLSGNGVHAEVANNGAEALEKFKSSPEGYYDLIFMDVQMPVMNGYEASMHIRTLPRDDAGKVWIVAMTANAFVEDIRTAREAGMNEHLAKPVNLEQLQEILHRQLGKTKKG